MAPASPAVTPVATAFEATVLELRSADLYRIVGSPLPPAPQPDPLAPARPPEDSRIVGGPADSGAAPVVGSVLPAAKSVRSDDRREPSPYAAWSQAHPESRCRPIGVARVRRRTVRIPDVVKPFTNPSLQLR